MTDHNFAITTPKILLVDDDPGVTEAIVVALIPLGAAIEACTDPLEAIKLLEKKSYDLVITDMQMPHIDGFEICKKVKSVDQTTPVIFISGLANYKDLAKIYDCGAIDFIEKPYNEASIIAKAKNALDLKYLSQKLVKLSSLCSHVARLSQSIDGENQEQIESFRAKMSEMKEISDAIKGLRS